MIDISIDEKKQFIVRLDSSDPNFQLVFTLVKSLLGSYEREENCWTVGYDDLLVFREKLNASGLTTNRSITEDAYQWCAYLDSIDERNVAIKSGLRNEEMKHLLEGKLKTVPYEDQYSAIAYLYHNKRCGLFDPMGVGKTAEAMAAASIMPDVNKVLVVCPYTVLPNFYKEIEKHTYLKPILVPQGKVKATNFVDRLKKNDDAWGVLLVHPENLVNTKSFIHQSELLIRLLEFPWDLIIIDEFHMYKNVDAKRTKCILSLAMDARDSWGKHPRIVVLTGTPVSESPVNAYVALKILNYGKVPHFSRFENHFVIKQLVDYGRRGSHMKVVGYKNLDELKLKLNRVSIRRTKEELKGFPDKVFLVREVELSGQQRELYKAICGELATNISRESVVNIQNFLSSGNAVLRLRQVMNHPKLIGEDGDSAKYEELDNILDEILADPEQKVVVWTEYRAAVDLLHQRYNDLYGAVKIYGGVTNDELVKIQDAFENSSWPRIAIAIPAKAGTGVDFLARARTAIYIDRPYSLVLYKQSLDRIHRRVTVHNPSPLDVIRAKPATIMFLDVADSIDVLVRDKLALKWDIAEAVTTSDDKLVEMGRSDVLKYLL